MGGMQMSPQASPLMGNPMGGMQMNLGMNPAMGQQMGMMQPQVNPLLGNQSQMHMGMQMQQPNQVMGMQMNMGQQPMMWQQQQSSFNAPHQDQMGAHANNLPGNQQAPEEPKIEQTEEAPEEP